MAALMALGLIASANMAEVWHAGPATVPAGQTEAAPDIDIDIDRWSHVSGIILPVMESVSLPGAATYAIALLKDSAIASTIGGRNWPFRAAMWAR
ncbi:hypothetical protein ERN12_16040 [Rhodobacteraceae bacterium]|nr:hypothetical protein ERN12_16040 [Paracoccaceae bacterium]